MKAPNEIYIYREPPKDYFEDGWVESKADDVESVPYIRKDALLEWAKERKEQAGIGLSEYDMGHENGICEVIEELIKHIESL